MNMDTQNKTNTRSINISNNNINNHSVLSQIQQNVNLQMNRQKMEQLASKRIEIQTALNSLESNNKDGTSISKNHKIDDSCWYYYMPSWNYNINTCASINQQDNDKKERDGTNNSKQSLVLSSMFLMEKQDIQTMLQRKLQQVELDLIQVCNDVQSNMDSLNKR